MNNNILNNNYDELRVVKSSRLPAKITAYLVSIDWLPCLTFLYGWRFFFNFPRLAPYFDNSPIYFKTFRQFCKLH